MKKSLKAFFAVILVFACLSQSTIGVFAASKSTEYVSEVFLSYGDTPEASKKYLTDNGYSFVDCNLNDGADDSIFLSKERAVYLGYKTTNDPEDAITDMKLMNMNGGYSVQDYQLILDEKKDDIQQFIKQFISVLREYRTNYKNGSSRAATAYQMLNMLKDDDTGILMGDLLLNKIKEEYSEDDFSALSEAEQKQHADMTTILMQGNAEMVLYIEQILATATDTNDVMWLDRFSEAQDYDTMLEETMDEENVTPDKAETILAARYDEDAKIIAGMADGYREWLADYTDCGTEINDSEEEVNDYLNGLSDAEKEIWLFKGAQYELLDSIAYDEDYSLLDLFLSDDFDITGEDNCLLYPIVSVLTGGQRSSLDFISGYQFFTAGYNTDTVTAGCNIEEILKDDDTAFSVYEGVDRSLFGNEVALTGDAYKLQTSSDKDYSTNWFDDGIDGTTKIFGIITVAAAAVTIGAWVGYAVNAGKAQRLFNRADYIVNHWGEFNQDTLLMIEDQEGLYLNQSEVLRQTASGYSKWANVFKYAGIGLTVCSILLSAYTLWCSYEDLKEYYNTNFTPIPLWMVDQSVDENDEKIFTYYKVASCNRIEGKFTADNTRLLNDSGDINGDVGKQWLALYTTTDKNAGDPIVADFKTQTGNSDIPGTYTPLSISCSQTAQNLTDAKSGFTYNDSNGGIYLFYNTQSSLFAGSAVTTGMCAAIAGGVIIIGLAVFLVIRKKYKARSQVQL